MFATVLVEPAQQSLCKASTHSVVASGVCGAAASGKFCGSCGTALGPRHCTACGTSAAPGARFCRQCGLALGGSTTQPEPKVPWIIAGMLCFAAIAGVVYSAGKRGEVAPPSMANAGNSTGTAPAALGPAPDISNMTPREQFARLNDRVRLHVV